MQNSENAKNRLFGELPGNIDAAKDAGTELRAIRKYAGLRRINTYLDDIHEAGTRAAKIVENMLQFTRVTESRFSYLNINSLIDRAIDLAMNDYDLKKKYDFRKIKIIKNYSELPEIQCHETQIEQVFLSIFKNAAQAMNSMKFDDTVVPTLKITTHSQNATCTIEISDNGPGMDEVTRKKIFEPFFTTREPGAGTGLGLSVSFYIIVTGHGGTISVESSPGGGSVFIITLPEIRRNR
jgi:signal transduction histidine kinase